MLNAGGLDARLDLTAVPVLEGVEALLADGVRSSLHPANAAFGDRVSPPDDLPPDGADLLYDPQTSGGLVATIPAARAAACVRELRTLGYGQAAVIGTAEAPTAGIPGRIHLLRSPVAAGTGER
jgi:selenide,water dikinase